MSEYSDFAQEFLEALYLETEESGKEYHRAGTLIKKYGLQPKPHWIARLADDWEHSNFKEVSRVLDGYDSWSFRISAQGSRLVEESIEADEAIEAIFGKEEKTEIERISDQLVPASNRMVSISNNEPLRAEISAKLDEISRAVSQSNSLEVDEKSDVVESLGLAKRLIEKSSQFLVGAFRYLVVERIKKAFEKTIEDALRVVILGAIGALALIILAAS